jgi:D-erythronate 2-dehydrogenase
MKIIITGGGGFLGSQLCQKILTRGTLCGKPVGEIVLLDAFFRAPATDARVKQVTGDIGDRATVFGSDRQSSGRDLPSGLDGQRRVRGALR